MYKLHHRVQLWLQIMLLLGLKISYYLIAPIKSIPSNFHSYHSRLKNLIIKTIDKIELPLGLHYKPKPTHLQAKVATRGWKMEEKVARPPHPTQLNPRQHEPLDGRMGVIHGSQWSSLRPCEVTLNMIFIVI